MRIMRRQCRQRRPDYGGRRSTADIDQAIALLDGKRGATPSGRSSCGKYSELRPARIDRTHCRHVDHDKARFAHQQIGRRYVAAGIGRVAQSVLTGRPSLGGNTDASTQMLKFGYPPAYACIVDYEIAGY